MKILEISATASVVTLVVVFIAFVVGSFGVFGGGTAPPIVHAMLWPIFAPKEWFGITSVGQTLLVGLTFWPAVAFVGTYIPGALLRTHFKSDAK